MSDTPRTNAAWAKYKKGRGEQHLRSESCRLERELKIVTDDLAFRRELGALQQQEYDKVTAERDALKAKLATINHIAMSLFVRSTSSEVTGEMAEIGRLSREDGQ